MSAGTAWGSPPAPRGSAPARAPRRRLREQALRPPGRPLEQPLSPPGLPPGQVPVARPRTRADSGRPAVSWQVRPASPGLRPGLRGRLPLPRRFGVGRGRGGCPVHPSRARRMYRRHLDQHQLELQSGVGALADGAQGLAQQVDEGHGLGCRDPRRLVAQHCCWSSVMAMLAGHLTGVLDDVHVAQMAEQVLDELGVVGGRPGSRRSTNSRAPWVSRSCTRSTISNSRSCWTIPSMSSVCCRVMAPPEYVDSWSRMPMASRKLPPAARAMTVSDASATSMPSCCAIPASTPTTSIDRRAAEVEALAARQDGGRHLVRLGGGQHEDGVRRRLLQRLEQGVEGLGGEHVDLVDDVDLHPPFDRREVDLVAQIADIVDAAVGGGVHLDDVHGAASADGLAVGAGAVGMGGRLALAGVAVEGHGQDLGRGGLARAARTGEEVRVAHAVLSDGVDEGAGDVLLPDDVLETGGAVLAVEGDRHAPKDPC